MHHQPLQQLEPAAVVESLRGLLARRVARRESPYRAAIFDAGYDVIGDPPRIIRQVDSCELVAQVVARGVEIVAAHLDGGEEVDVEGVFGFCCVDGGCRAFTIAGHSVFNLPKVARTQRSSSTGSS